MSTVLPQIKNASLALLKLLAMETGEELLLNRSELPKAYTTPQQLVNFAMKRYDCAFVVLRTLEVGAYRIIRLKDASEIKNYAPVQRRAKKESKQLLPTHTLAQPDLEQLADSKLNFAERDEADLGPRGINMPYITSVRAMVTELKNTRSDIESVSFITVAADKKNTIRTNLYNNLNELRRMGKNALDEIQYSIFNFEGLVALNDVEFAARAKQIHRKAGKPEYNILLLPQGCTAGFMNETATLIVNFNSALDTVEDRENERILTTYNRTLLGNRVYKEIVKICSTGKSVYQYVIADPARWEDYVVSN